MGHSEKLEAIKEQVPSSPRHHVLTAYDYFLYAAVVFAWSFSWWPLKIQAASFVADQVSLTWRFLACGILMLLWCLLTKQAMRFSIPNHLRFALLGVLLFSTNFLLFYLGSDNLPSGLLSVMFSLASVVNSVLVFLLFREKPSPRIVFGGFLGFAGLGVLFWPEISAQDYSWAVVGSVALCACGTLSFCCGNIVSASNKKKDLPLVPMTTYGMFYGAIWCAILAAVNGKTFTFDTSFEYVASLSFLVVVSSLIAFASYLTLLGRIGPARAGYATVMFPVLALLISTVVEDYRWTLVGFVGLAMVLAGNVVVLRSR